MAIHFPSISSVYAADRAVARTPAARQSSTQPALSQKELAQTVAAAAAPSSSSSSSTSTSGSTAAGASGTSSSSSSNTSTAATAASTAASATSTPTAESVFGANPWLTDPTGTGPTGTYGYNPYYFATAQTAADVASLVGGTVVQVDEFAPPMSGPFAQNQPNEMVQLSNGTLLNPGLVASFYTHGYSQSTINDMISSEVTNVTKGT